jgi:hypothetical protein
MKSHACRLASIAGLCIVLAACSRQDSVFSLAPTFKGQSASAETSVAACIASRWKNGTRKLTRTRRDGVIRMRAQTFFTGITIGVRLHSVAGQTLVEYFERRFADRVYVGMVRGCLSPTTVDTTP